MATVFIVYFRSHDSRSEDASETLGVYTTRTLAEQAAMAQCDGADAEWIIHRCDLNRTQRTAYVCSGNVDGCKHAAR